LNKIIVGAIAAVVIAIIAVVVATQNFENELTLKPVSINQKLGLVVNTPSVATTLEELNHVYQQAASTGVGRSNVYLFWNILEPQKDQFDFNESDILMSFNKKNNMQVTVFFSVVNGPTLGPFPDWMGTQSLDDELAENTARVLDVILSRYHIVDSVIIGGDLDSQFRYNEEKIGDYEKFFNTVYEKVKQKHPTVQIGNSFALHDVFNKQLEHIVNDLIIGDFVGFTYFPVDSLNDISKDPQQARMDLDKIFELVPDKKIAIFEISWSTSDFVKGNVDDQVNFLETSYDFYRDNESKIEFFTWYRQYDRPEGTCFPDQQEITESKISVGGGSGLGSSEFVIERLGYYLCNSGLVDVKGNLKPGWSVFKTQIQQSS
jgi:hypothetical protein